MIDFRRGTMLPPPSDDDIRALEEGLRVKFPASYVEMIRVGNGGVPLAPCFDVGSRERLIERMLCVLQDPNAHGDLGWYDVACTWSQISDRLTDNPDLVGAEVVPIAALFAGDFVCLDYRSGVGEPSVVLWEHDASVQPSLETVAPSFDAFLAMLHESTDEDARAYWAKLNDEAARGGR
jgi:SMI1-KNR4 cell-wall